MLAFKRWLKLLWWVTVRLWVAILIGLIHRTKDVNCILTHREYYKNERKPNPNHRDYGGSHFLPAIFYTCNLCGRKWEQWFTGG